MDTEDHLCPSVTSLDAVECKISSVLTGYFEDPFLRRISDHIQHTRKMPIINRGYYNRIKCIHDVVNTFISLCIHESRIQLVNLGAGYDTLSLNLLTTNTSLPLFCFEVDFATVLARKSRLLEYHCTDLLPSSAERHLKHVAADLGDASGVLLGLEAAGFDPAAPTIFITECVLVYMSCEKSSALLSTLLGAVKQAATRKHAGAGKCLWVSYDMIEPKDAFGRVMCRNLQSAGHHVPGFTDYPSLAAQKQRFLTAGCATASSCTMLHAYHVLVSAEEQMRLHRIEMLDEVEEWELINKHYAVTIGCLTDEDNALDIILKKYQP